MLDTLPSTKSLPHSDEAERAVLGAILIDPRILPVVAGRLTPEDFYFERHQLIFTAMLDLQGEQSAIDLLTVHSKLSQRAQAERVGGVGYLAALDVALPDLGRSDDYVEIVKERSLRRRLIAAAGETIRDCLDGGVAAQEALGRAEQAVLSLGQEAVQRGFVPIGKILDETIAELEDRPGSAVLGVPTGFHDLDRMTQGLNKGNLIIIAGRP
nr:DnaB-like helicase N-terminal domain-containing protein [Thermoanaerobaculia bacterium]